MIDTITPLKSVASFYVGAALNVSQLKNNTQYSNTVITNYNSITAENAMKFGVEPSENVFDFSDADYLVGFAQAHGMRIHGHNLIWHAYLPKWVQDFSGDSSAWENLFKTHIQTEVTHFKGKVVSWDVVNEAFNDDGTLRKAHSTPSANGTKDGSIWARNLGDDYVARAFKYAHEADPDALLFYNDYGQDYAPAKLTALLNMVKDFKSRGIPINGIGLQMHIRISSDNNSIKNVITQCAATGLQIHISELDISMSKDTKNSSLTYTSASKQLESDKYEFISSTYKSVVPAAQQFGITTWGVSDATSWLRSAIQTNEWPLLFDDNYLPKPCFYGFENGLK